MSDLRATAQQHLTRLAGPSAVLRDDQWTAIEALVEQRRKVVVIQRTGWGKSAVYWIAAGLRRAAGSGPALVISPLLALMRDQVAAATRSGLHAVTLNSANIDDWSAIEARIAADEVDVLLISPERLNSAGFRSRVLPNLAPRIGLLVVDEAHCVSDWGSDFRPDYRRIRDVLAGLPDGTPVLATTATANDRVTADVAAQLGTDTLTLRGSLDRESLALSVVPTPDLPTAYAWIADALEARPAGFGVDLHADRRRDDPARGVPRRARARGRGVLVGDPARRARADREAAARARTAGGRRDLEPRAWGSTTRRSASSSISARRRRRSRTTSRSDVPAARSTKRTRCCCPPAPTRRSGRSSTRPRSRPRIACGGCWRCSPTARCRCPGWKPIPGLRRTRLETLLKVLDVDGAVERVDGGWVATGRAWVYDAAAVRGDRRGAAPRAARHAALRARRVVPDAAAACRAGRPDRGRLRPVRGVHRTAAAARAVARHRACRAGAPAFADGRHRAAQDVAVRRTAPRQDRRAGRAEPGRALALAEDPAWLDAVSAALQGDQPVSAEVFDGIVGVLSKWGWPAGRPTWVTWVPSRRHGGLLADLAERLATLGRMAVATPLHADGPGLQADAATNVDSARLALNRLSVDGEVPAGPVLLLDDIVRSGFTLTVAAALLREAGAGPVYPLVLHKTF